MRPHVYVRLAVSSLHPHSSLRQMDVMRKADSNSIRRASDKHIKGIYEYSDGLAPYVKLLTREIYSPRKETMIYRVVRAEKIETAQAAELIY